MPCSVHRSLAALARRVAAAVLPLAIALPSAVAAAEPSLRIAVSRTPLSAPIFIAEARGFFREAGVAVQLEECIGGHRCLARVLEGSADFGTVSESPVAFRSFGRSDFAIVSTFVTSENDVKLVASRARGITSPRDLAGKRVGTVLGTSSHFFLDVFLLFHGIDPSAIEVVGLSPEDMVGALARGEVDAISAWEPFGYLSVASLGSDATVLSAEGIYRETFNLVCLRSRCESAGPRLTAILYALSQSVSLIEAAPVAAQAVVKERLGLEADFVDWIWPDFQFGLSLDQSLLLTLESTAEWALDKGLVQGPTIANFLAYVYPGPLRSLEPEQVTLLYRN